MRRLAPAFAALLYAGLLACGDYPSQNSANRETVTMLYAGGNAQTGAAGTALPEKLAVRVARGSAPVAGRVVEWELAGEVDRTTTNSQGVAAVTWTLPTRVGIHHASATISGAGTLQFQAQANPGPAAEVRGPPDHYAYITEQVGVIGAPAPMDYMAAVTDLHGNVVPDASLEWEVTAGGGSVEEQTPYDDYQQARHTVGTSPGLNTVTATAPALPGRPSVTFTTTGVHALVLVPQFETVIVHVGETVGWQWGTQYDYEYDMGPPDPHDIVFEDASSAPESATERRFGVHTRTFQQVGRYRYRCTLHSTDFEQGHVGEIAVLP